MNTYRSNIYHTIYHQQLTIVIWWESLQRKNLTLYEFPIWVSMITQSKPISQKKKKNWRRKERKKQFEITMQMQHDFSCYFVAMFSAIWAKDCKLQRTIVSTNTHVSSLVLPEGTSTTKDSTTTVPVPVPVAWSVMTDR